MFLILNLDFCKKFAGQSLYLYIDETCTNHGTTPLRTCGASVDGDKKHFQKQDKKIWQQLMQSHVTN